MKVLIIGGGPAGSTAAYYLASAGHEVTVLEKTHYPREKVCGDGLTPRAVREIQLLGLPHEGPGWRRNKGLRLIAGGKSMELPWPELENFPDYGLIRTREGFDADLAAHARAAGATILEGHAVTQVLQRDGRVVGARARIEPASVESAPGASVRGVGSARLPAARETRDFSADVVLACDGNSTRAAVSAGLAKRDDRPMGVAVRGYFESPRHDDDWMEGWLELPDASGKPLPGYGWIFGVGDGTSNVGLGILNSSKQFGKIDYKAVLREWTANMPPEWGYTPDNLVGQVRGAALPMGFNRTPHYVPGMLLLGDAGGMVSPFNGEGISYAMESARYAADVLASAANAGTLMGRERMLERYPEVIRQAWGKHFTLGKLFAEIIGHPQLLKVALTAGMSLPALMRFVVRFLANLTEKPGQLPDQLIRLIESAVPAADNRAR